MAEKYPKKRAYAYPPLAKFLKEKGVYEQFVENCKNYNNQRWHKTIGGAFLWIRTPEDTRLWHLLDEEFNDKIRTK
jgi:DNA-binding transcriptional MocR family regulator